MTWMINGGKRNKTLDKYFNMPEMVMRNGVLVNIRENNLKLGVKGSKQAIKGYRVA